MATVDEKHSKKLKDVISQEITAMFEAALDFAQVACPEPNFKPLRSKILRVGNNCIRNIHKSVDDHFKVEYKAPAEDIVEVKQAKK
jgi:hypothetical protein